jgi:RNA polymerase sigma factor (sigma-70 family)
MQMHITNELLARINNNEPKAYEELFNAVYTELTVFGYRMVDNIDEAEDIAITAFTRILNKKDLIFEAVEQLRAYLYVSVRNSALNYLRVKQKEDPIRKKLQTELPTAEEPAVEKKYEMDYLRKLLDIALGKLQLERQCESVIRLYLKNQSPDEIAKELNISMNQVYTQRSKGVKALKKFMEEHGDKYEIPVVLILLALLFKICFG